MTKSVGEQDPLTRYESMVEDVVTYLDYTRAMEDLSQQMLACSSKTTKTYEELSMWYRAHRVARENYLEKCLARYQVTNLDGLRQEMRALEPSLRGATHPRDAEREKPPPDALPLPQGLESTGEASAEAWLASRIVKLALAHYELSQIGEQIEALDQHADYLVSQGQAVPEAEQAERLTWEQAYTEKFEEVRAAFTPSASYPFALEGELAIYCQTLLAVKEHGPPMPERGEQMPPSAQPQPEPEPAIDAGPPPPSSDAFDRELQEATVHVQERRRQERAQGQKKGPGDPGM